VSNDEAVHFVCDYLYAQMLLYLTVSVSRHSDAYVDETTDSSSSSSSSASDIPPLSSQYLPSDAMHNAARELALEAYVRGSGDNIGVCIIEID
jgi:hypothetical protein